MKQFITVALSSVLFITTATAQIDATAAKAALDGTSAADSTGNWNTGGVMTLNFTNVGLSNWAAGGVSSASGVAMFNGFANKRWGRNTWDNNLAVAYGLLQQKGQDLFKSDDRIELNSRYGYDLKEGGKWAIAGMLQFRSQFTEGFDINDRDLKISNLLAPGYLLIGAGLTYKPNDKFSVFFSPAMSKMTFVIDQDLANAGAFGVDAAEIDSLDNIVTEGANSRFELGGFVAAQYTTDLAENIKFLTRADLFSNYLDRPQNIDVSWETMTTFKVNDWFGCSFNTLLIYDHDIDIQREIETLPDGTPDPNQIMSGPATQFKHVLGMGLTFNLK